MSGAQCTPQHRLIDQPCETGESARQSACQSKANASLLRTTVRREGQPQRQSSAGPRNSTLEGRSVTSMPTRVRQEPTCPECGGPAASTHERDQGDEHHVYGACKLGHIWDLRWFAVRGA